MSPGRLASELAAIVGAEHATVEDAGQFLPAIFGPSARGAAPAVARVEPGATRELQAVVRFAGENGLAVWSTPNASGNGARFGNGAKPALLVDLSRMNRIVEFDARSACALVEPGVSYDDLRAYIAERSLPFWVDCDVNGAHSVSGSICERTFGYTPYGDHVLMQCGMEVVLANGELVRTGMGALPGNNTWQLFKYNFGPYLDGLFSRSDFALVSRMGLWVMPAPPAFQPFAVTLPDLRAVGAAVELLRPHKIAMTVANTVAICDAASDAALLRAAGGKPGPAATAGAPGSWTLYGALYGLPTNVAFLWQALGEALAGLPGGSVLAGLPGGQAESLVERGDDRVWRLRSALMQGIPAYSRAGPSPERTLSLTASAALEGDDAQAMHHIAATALAAHDVPFRAEFALTWRTLLCRIDIPCDESDYAPRRAAALAAAASLAAAGYAITHDGADLSAALAATQTGPGLAHLYDALGRALDPGATLGTRGR